MFGLSYRCVEKFCPCWIAEAAKAPLKEMQKAKSLHFDAPAMRVRILGVDGKRAYELCHQLKTEGLQFESENMLELFEILSLRKELKNIHTIFGTII